MKRFIFLFFLVFIFFSFHNVSASLDLSSGKLTLNLESGKGSCQSLIISSEDYSGDIKVRDVWSKNIGETNINKYNLGITELGGSISYDNLIEDFEGEKEIEICLFNNNINDNIRGAVIFTPTTNTNVVVEVGTWIFLNPLEPALTQETNSTTKKNKKSSKDNIEDTLITSQDETKNEETQNEIIKLINKGGAGITGAVIGIENKKIGGLIITSILTICTVLIFYIKTLKAKKKKKRK